MARESQYSWFNLMVVMVLCLGSLTYGYCFSVITNTLGQPGFYEYMDMSQDRSDPRFAYSNKIIGACNGIFSTGGFFGALTLGWLCRAYGRKWSLLLSSAITILGGALSGGSAHIAMFIIGRLITGFGVGMLVTLVPIYQAEIAPPASRGFLGSQHGVILVLGYAIAAWTGVGTYYSTNPSFQWRFPLCLECLFPLLILLLSPIVPESPRWLIMNDQTEKAWEITRKLHNNPSDVGNSFARTEFYQMVSQVQADKPLVEKETVLDLFRKPSYRKRMICGGLMTFSCECTGILVIYSYSVKLYQGLGFSGALPLILGASYTTCPVPANYISALLMDRLGRKTLTMAGLIGCTIALCFESALTASFQGTTNTAGLRASVFFLFLYTFIYGCCLDATGFVFCAEIFPTHIRPQGMGFSVAVLFLTTIPFLTGAATAFSNIGWKFYLLFICISAANVVIVYLIFPETKCLTLEEINEKFNDNVAVYITHMNDEERARIDQMIDTVISGGDAGRAKSPQSTESEHKDIADLQEEK